MDLYAVLQVDPKAQAEVIEVAYRRLARIYHPDVNKAPDAEAVMKRLNRAYEVLSDPKKRAKYDRVRAIEAGRTAGPQPVVKRRAREKASSRVTEACLRCGGLNEPGSTDCSKCGLPLEETRSRSAARTRRRLPGITRRVFFAVLVPAVLVGLLWVGLIGLHFRKGASLGNSVAMTVDDARVAVTCPAKPRVIMDFLGRSDAVLTDNVCAGQTLAEPTTD